MAGILERRRSVRRALAGGAVLGAVAGVFVGVLDAVYVWATAGASLDGAGEVARFLLAVVGILAGVGMLAGAAQGLVAAAVHEAARSLGERRRDGGIWPARFYTMLMVPPVALVCAQIFAGPRARAIPFHDAYAMTFGVATLALWWAGVRRWYTLYRPSLSPRTAGWLATLALVGALVLYVANQRVLVRLYPFFHIGLVLLTFGAAEVAVALVHLGLRRRAVVLLRPTMALFLAIVAGAAGVGAMALLSRTRALRAVVIERTALAGPVAKLLARLTPARVPTTVAATSEARPLPEGPHLGAVDVVLVTIDALRADRLSARTAPFLTSLAAGGVLFERAYAQVPHTSFSLATLLTGKYVYALSTLGLDAASHQTLAEVLRRERYKTAAFYPPSVFTIDRDRLRKMEDSQYGFEYVKYEHMDAPGRTDQVIQFLDSEKPTHAFVWVHYFEPHEPYDLHPGPFAGAREAVERYDGEIRFVDDELARLVAYLKKTRPRTLLVVAADHGEEFGEHGGRYHGTALYEEQARVPLAFVPLDGAGFVPHRVATPVGLVDVAPTILSLIGIVPSARMRGRDLGPWLLPTAATLPADAHGPVFAEIGQQKTIVDGHKKLICDLGTDACSAFDLAADPGERRNRIDEPWATALRARLDAWMAGESRYESAGAEGDARTRRILERARLGDKTVAPELAPLAEDPAQAAEVVHLLATLPADAKTRPALARVTLPAARAWADVALARLGDAEARARVTPQLLQACADGVTGDYCARAALAVGDVRWLGRALGRGDADEQLQLELARALGRSHDAAALDPLVLQLANVRTRVDTLGALAELDDARVLPTLLMWVPAEPYVPARARMVALIAQLARHDGEAAARAALAPLAAVEREPPVMAQLLPALHALGDSAVVELARHPARALAGGELWLSGSGNGFVDVTVSGTSARAAFTDGVARAPTARAGSAALRVVDGDARPRLAFSRRAP